MELNDIPKYIQIGMKDKDWYQQCEQTLVELFGRHRLVLVANLLAATSIGSSLKSNVQLFRKALYQMENDLPFVGYLPNIIIQLEYLRAGQELSGLKIKSFARAMSGGTQAVVVDRWLLRAFKMDRQYMRHTGPHRGKTLSGGATDKQYAMIEEWVRNKAFDMGLEPRQLSAIIWSGARISMGGDRETHYTNVLKLKMYNMYDKI
jgi:hypothetical protein